MKNIATCLLVLAMGCSESINTLHSERHVSADPGSFDGPADLSALPSTDVPEARLSSRMRFGWSLAQDALAMRMPTPPERATADQLQTWTETQLEPWIGEKAHAIETATNELRRAAYSNGREQIMAAAIIALLYESMARDLRRIPTPVDLQSDREAAVIYQDVVEHFASPYAGRAHIAYHNCEMDRSVAPARMRHWAEFCSERKNRLEPAGLGSPERRLESGEVEVSVVNDES